MFEPSQRTDRVVVWNESGAFLVPDNAIIDTYLTITKPVPVGGQIWWEMDNFNHTWASYTNITPAGGCGTIEGCASLTGAVPGFECPA